MDLTLELFLYVHIFEVLALLILAVLLTLVVRGQNQALKNHALILQLQRNLLEAQTEALIKLGEAGLEK